MRNTMARDAMRWNEKVAMSSETSKQAEKRPQYSQFERYLKSDVAICKALKKR